MNVVVVAAHPDDETLGCGGTIIRHRAGGHDVRWIVVTEARSPRWTTEMVEQKKQEIAAAAAAYGFADVHRLGHEAATLGTVAEGDLVDRLRNLCEPADIVYVVSGVDVHSDHRLVFDAVCAAVKPFRRAGRPQRLLSYETLSSTDAAAPAAGRTFAPNVFIDVSPHMHEKLRILTTYASELHQGFGPRTADSVRALGRLRGATIGVEYAEAFMLVREIL